MIKIKRIYEKETKDDGYRVLVDRLWPRGVKKDDAKIDDWMKDIAPSDELRKWFNHEAERWSVFRKKYFKELENKSEMIKNLKSKSKNKTLTHLYSAKDTIHNQAAALREFLSIKT